jgi:sugar phosphate isomerase/epimerase
MPSDASCDGPFKPKIRADALHFRVALDLMMMHTRFPATRRDMKLGFLTAILPELNLNQVLEFAAAERFACVEVMCWPVGKAERRFAGVTHIDVTDFTKAQAEDVNALCAKHGVSISALGYYPNPLDPDPAIATKAVSHFKKVILAAGKLGLKNANSFVGRDWTKTVDENWPRFLKTWKPLIAFAEDHGIRVGIENCPMSFSRDEWPGGKNLAISPAIWRRMFSDIPSQHFGLNYDPSHLVLQQMDYVRPLYEFGHKFFHVHAKDMIIDPQRLDEVGIFAFTKEWHTPRIPGFGDINWARFMAALRQIGYDGPVCIEVEDDTFGQSLAGRKHALRIARNVLEPYF